jgi:hypothetical protein
MADPELNDIYALLMGQGDAPKLQAQAMAARLRGQQDTALLAQLGLPMEQRAAGIGAQAAAQAKQGQDLLEKAAVNRLHYGPESWAQKAEIQRQRDAAALQKTMEKIASDRFKITGTPTSGGFTINKATGQVEQIDPTVNPNKPVQKDPTDAAWERFVNKTNSGVQSSRSILGVDQSVADRVDRAITLIKSKPYRTPEEVNELGVALGTVVQQGSVAARKTIEDISYKTLGMRYAEAIQWLSGHPQDARMGEFVQRIQDVLEAERGSAKERIRQKVKTHAIGNRELVQKKADVSKDYLSRMGLDQKDLAELGIADPFEEAPPPPPPPTTDLRKKYGL